jgi:nucleotide-binding universal stress UspA family protein
MIKIQTILVPMDFSPPSDHALNYAIHLAGTVDSCIQLLHCYGAAFFTSVPYDHVPAIPADYEKTVREAARRKLDIYVDRAKARGLEVGAHLSNRSPVDAILSTAGEVNADLIVMGTHGWTGIKHLLLGSVAERTIRLAECPVLTVRHPVKDPVA